MFHHPMKGPSPLPQVVLVVSIRCALVISREKGGSLHHSLYNRRVSLRLEAGVETTDFAKIGREEHLNKLEVDALRIQRSLEEVSLDLEHFKRREELHRDTTESTNARVMWLSVTSMIVIVCIGVWQLIYLRRFFTQKKLL